MEQGSTNMVPMSEMPHPNIDQYADYCAAVWERVEAGSITVDQATELMFDKEPDFTFVRYTA